MQESLAAILELTFEFWPYCGLVASRLGAKPIQPLCFMECRDGWIFICCVEEHQWRHFVEIMGNPEWAAMELFENRLARGANFDALQALPPGVVPRAVGRRSSTRRRSDGACRSRRSRPWATCSTRRTCARAASSPRIDHPVAGAGDDAGRAVPLLGDAVGAAPAGARASGSTPPRCSPRSASTPAALAREGVAR